MKMPPSPMLCYAFPQIRNQNHAPGATSVKRYLTALTIIAMTCASAGAQQQLVDKIAAVVDQEIILLSDIQLSIGDQIQDIERSAATQADKALQSQRLMAQALEILIENNILYREALRSGLEITDERVEQAVKDYRAGFDTEEDATEYLNKTGYTYNDIRELERKRLLALSASYSKQQSIDRSIVISESEVTEYFEEHKDEFVQPERVRIRQIMFRAAEGSDGRQDAIARMELLRDEIRNGASFEELAKKYSEAPGAEDGGIIGWQKKGDLVPVLDEAAFSLENGEVSDVLASQFGVHLLKVDERQAAGEIELKEARAIIEPKLRQELITERLNLWVADLRKTSNVRVYLKG